MIPKRGEVWLVSLDPVAGHEKAGTRPVFVLSVDAFIVGPSKLVTIVPITSKEWRENPFRIAIKRPAGGLSVTSYVIGEQIRTISRARMVRRMGKVSEKVLASVADVPPDVLAL